MDAPRINPDDHLGLVTKRKPEDWGTAYIALSSAALTFDNTKGVPFPAYADKVINWRVYDDHVEDMANRKHRNHKRTRGAKVRYTGKVYPIGAMGNLRRSVPFVYPPDPAPLKNLGNPKLDEVRHLLGRGLTQTQIGRAIGITTLGVHARMRLLRGTYGTSHKNNVKRSRRGKEESAHGASDGVPDTPAEARSADHRAA